MWLDLGLTIEKHVMFLLLMEYDLFIFKYDFIILGEHIIFTFPFFLSNIFLC